MKSVVFPAIGECTPGRAEEGGLNCTDPVRVTELTPFAAESR